VRNGEASALAERYARSIDVQACTPFFLWFAQVALGQMTPPEGLLASLARIEALPPNRRTEIRFTANDVAVLCLWGEHRQVINPDPDLWAELADTRADMVIPSGLFERMPYPDPFVAFPEPLVLPLDDGQYMTVGGFFVTGRRQIGLQIGQNYSHVGEVPVSLADSYTEPDGHRRYGLLFTAETWNADGSPVYIESTGERDMIWTRLTIRDGASVDELLAHSFAAFVDTNAGGDAHSQARAMLRAAVGVMIYLCADNRDVRVVNPPPVRKSKAKGKAARQRPTVVEVGHRVGATIRKYRRERAQFRASNPTGRTLPPHLRAAHFQSFRVGPGRPNERTETVVKWVSFIEVNMGKRTRDDRPTVHRATGRVPARETKRERSER
jgi:hypothetical protein